MDIQEELEKARALSYEGTPWQMIERAATAHHDEVREYLMGHAERVLGAGVRRVVHVEARVPWGELEVWMLELVCYPYNPSVDEPGAQRRDEVRAWLDALAGVPLDRGERDWRLLLGGLAWCRSGSDMSEVCRVIDPEGGGNAMDSDGWNSDFITIGNDKLVLGSANFWMSVTMLEEGQGTINSNQKKSHPARAAQLAGITPPARVLARLG